MTGYFWQAIRRADQMYGRLNADKWMLDSRNLTAPVK